MAQNARQIIDREDLIAEVSSRPVSAWVDAASALLAVQRREHMSKIRDGSKFDASDARVFITAIAGIEKQFRDMFAPETPPSPAPKRRGRPPKIVATEEPASLPPAPPLALPTDPDERLVRLAEVLCPPGWEEKYRERIKACSDQALEQYLKSDDPTDLAFYRELERFICQLDLAKKKGELAMGKILNRPVRPWRAAS